MEIGGAELHVGIPAIAHEFSADDFLSGVGVSKRFGEKDEIALDLLDVFNLEGFLFIHAHADECAGMKTLAASYFNARRSRRRVFLERFSFYFEWTDRLLVVEAGAYAV